MGPKVDNEDNKDDVINDYNVNHCYSIVKDNVITNYDEKYGQVEINNDDCHEVSNGNDHTDNSDNKDVTTTKTLRTTEVRQ